MYGCAAQELVGKCMMDFIHPEDVPWLQDLLSNRFAGIQRNGHAGCRYRRKCGDGEYERVHCVYVHTHDTLFFTERIMNRNLRADGPSLFIERGAVQCTL